MESLLGELIRTVEESSDLTLPGWEPEKMARIKELFEAYQTVDEKQLWANLEFFLHEILPVAEEHGIQMAIHPDDPPVNFGLPVLSPVRKVMKSARVSDSPANCITLCTGSMGADPANDMVKITKHYAGSRRLPIYEM